ncbi:SDR family oxidoreductase [Psychrobacter sp. NG25]|jgi:meso-butanediol dehydrogenase/(S,S)-butanediol dehydrogenase/diacetyl reductase|uniref:SDR family NAD(P)-dependent oxidoreductase n=1 Tax=Psychrobacter sp. NG25 TaxID=2782005 RepID=UPI001883B6AC|nr:SDR family oxidoreductase [Psychrobacter sp. NG25]MBF0659851.1 SDR family oxidoreductase [Psychrobacter sp. NG25]
MKRFKEKTVIITGADSDIGRATALRFAQEGANCIIVGINSDILGYIYEDLPQDHTWINTGNHLTVTSDINDPTQTARLVEHVLEKYNHIDVMVNIDTAVGIHQSVIPELIKTKGNIVNISALTDLSADWSIDTYKAEQKKLTELTKKLALENIPNNVRINAVTAGFVTTDVSSNSFVTHSPLGKTATPFDVTAAVMFLASDDAAIITGMNLPVDGGVSTFTN